MSQPGDEPELPPVYVSEQEIREKAQAALRTLQAKDGMDLVELFGLDRLSGEEDVRKEAERRRATPGAQAKRGAW